MKIGHRERGQKVVTDGRLQDFVHEATQIDIPTNFEKNPNKSNYKAINNIISIQNKNNPSSTVEDLRQLCDDS